MWLMVVSFRFKSEDLPAEEKNYLDNHLGVAKRLPGVSLYLAGKLRATRKLQPRRYRTGIIGFPDGKAAGKAFSGPDGAHLMQDTQAHMTDLAQDVADMDVVVPFPVGAAGQPCFAIVASIDLRTNVPNVETCYLGEHRALVAKLPGLRGYASGKLLGRPERLALLSFDDYDAMRAAYRSPAGIAVRASLETLVSETRLSYVDATTVV